MYIDLPLQGLEGQSMPGAARFDMYEGRFAIAVGSQRVRPSFAVGEEWLAEGTAEMRFYVLSILILASLL